MIASKSGTYTEQRRYDAGWKRPSELEKAQGERCVNCLHANIMPHLHQSIGCQVMECTTTVRCWCRHHVSFPPLLKREVVL